jgi:hypothetical protein
MVAHACSRMTSVAFYVGAEPEKNGVPHLGLTRPLGEFTLADELRNKPRGGVFGLHLLVEGLLIGAQGLHFSINRLQSGLVEARADMPSIDPGLISFVTYRELGSILSFGFVGCVLAEMRGDS